MKYFTKIRTILLSRFKKEKNESWVKERRIICFNCPHNTKNKEKISLKLKASKLLSDFYSLVTFSEYKELGSCSICTCPIFYKSREIEEECDAQPSKWKSIYIPNKQ